ncbi:transmembrane protein 254 [Anolis carolinensis]|uniref:Transmembrane protein 254 n=1 Tax=Anolis carolinensis TaxID=28377 RepID=A0A803T0M6_ANOCA|nr:PREDICTED: transmembrane protein 254 [Anolis carolinensis]|eukprot:XP_003227588.1 PREDICTED: transmembrane protein 254 [Anolis carolinensis]
MAAATRDPSTYFRRPKGYVMLLIAAGMGYYSWAFFAPASIPYDSLGPLGTFTKFLVEKHNAPFKMGYFISWAIHLGEALYALKLCTNKGVTDSITRLLWFVQTFAFGMFSLYHLLTYKPLRKASDGYKQKTK